MLMFVSIFGVGFVMLLITSIFGHDADTDVGHDFGGDADHGSHGPSIFSTKMLSLILVGFGAGGFGVRATTGAGMFAASMGGVAGAVVLGVIGYLIIRGFYGSQASSTVTDDDIIGCDGNLLDGIPEGGRGQVACVVRGREITFLARSKDGSPIKRGAPVKIVAKTAGVVTVTPLE